MQLAPAFAGHRDASEALAPAAAKTQETVLTDLAAKWVEVDGPEQPFPLSPLLGPPSLLAPAPWALPLSYGHTPPDRGRPASLV
jgi:hypothetical protein